jgi:RNA polymerase sigma-70 factor, ECF subfamily
MTLGQEHAAAEFERHRGHLLSVAYRLTSSWADAEDAVSETWLRWADHAGSVEKPVAWLTTAVSRICLDRLRSAAHRRETYVGPWLPEPLVQVGDDADPLDAVVREESVRLAFLVALDTLTAEQRVAVVLHDVLGLSFAEVAEVLGCSTAAARQHASRGRRQLDQAPPPPPAPPAEVADVLDRLSEALFAGDVATLSELLAPDVAMVADGGGQVLAAGRPLHGREEVTRFLMGLAERYGAMSTVSRGRVNGEPGLLLHVAESGTHHERAPRFGVYAVTASGGRVHAIYAILAPDKLTHVPGSPSVGQR